MKIIGGTLFLVLLLLVIPVKDPLFNDPYSTVLFSREGKMLGAKIATDGQWRFPEMDSLPDKYVQGVIMFEDRHFYDHPGINPFSIGRAIIENIEAGKVVRGGSTITMQLARMAYGNRKRTVWRKILEMWLAVRIELRYDKDEILQMYASHAPYGGNVVGLSAASWRYYGRSAWELSWAETANLAVLPNSPSMVFPGKNDDLLLSKRNRLLRLLAGEGLISDGGLEMALLEPLPGLPKPLPMKARHLLDRAVSEGHNGKRITTSIDLDLQDLVNDIIHDFHSSYKHRQIHNAAALVIDIQSGQALAYTGNTDAIGDHGQEVDIVTSKRSPGSLMKPVLYALAIDDGQMAPRQLLPDIPMHYRGFAPQNFDKKFKGAVHANQALRSSLNVPFVNILRDYGYEKFHLDLQRMGISSMDRNSGHYGLTMILGGNEMTLWEITALYAGMARTLTRYNETKGKKRYNQSDFHENSYLVAPDLETGENVEHGRLQASAIWHAFKTMQELRRPDAESNWERFGSARPIAWKTGTSFGHKDAWAVGLNSKYVVGVWFGNADGEGRPDLTGVVAAAPAMFRIFDQLEGDAGFPMPVAEMTALDICTESGYKAGPDCSNSKTEYVASSVQDAPPCPYHQVLHLDSDHSYQVNSKCYPVSRMQHISWFLLPPAQAWYYKRSHSDYREPPEFRSTCVPDQTRMMEMIYPRQTTRVYVPVEIDGQAGRVVFEAAHQNPKAKIYWHLDDEFVGITRNNHQLGLYPSTGHHSLSLVDDRGREVKVKFEVLNESRGD